MSGLPEAAAAGLPRLKLVLARAAEELELARTAATGLPRLMEGVVACAGVCACVSLCVHWCGCVRELCV